MEIQKMWAVINKNNGKVLDTGSINFARRATEHWLKIEKLKFGKKIIAECKLVKIEVKVLD